jgi:hypothetical protein
LISEAFRLALAPDQPDLYEVAYVVGLGIRHSLTEQENDLWSQAVGAEKQSRLFSRGMRPLDSLEENHSDFSHIPMELARGFVRHKKIELARSLTKYAYFEHRVQYEKVLTDSLDQVLWLHNLLELMARLTMPMRMPVSLASGFTPPFMPRSEVVQFSNEHLEVMRLLGCVYSAVSNWSADSQYLLNYKREAQRIAVRKGRPEARKYLTDMHRRTLEIPTYTFQAFSDALKL